MLKCASRCEEQSINTLFHSSMPGSRVIVADCTNSNRLMLSRWELVPELSLGPLEIDQIRQLLKCASRCEEQSMNTVLHYSKPGSRVIVADCTNCCRGM